MRTMIQGNYISELMTDEYGFSLWILNDLEIQDTWREQLLDLDVSIHEGEMRIPRIKMVETLLTILKWNVEISEQLRAWIRLMQWSMRVAELGCFYPGMMQDGNIYYSKWMIDFSLTKIREELHEWIRFFRDEINGKKSETMVPAFVGDCLDSYIRLVINTRFSLNSGSELAKFLRYRPFYTHEEWFNHLCTEEYVIETGKRWGELFDQVTHWVSSKSGENLDIGHLGFRLRALDEDSWYIEYIWQDVNGKLKGWTELRNTHLRDEFMRQLAEASVDYPLLAERSEHTPYFCAISMNEAYVFLRHLAPRLRLKGFAVWAPPSLVQSKKARLGMQVKLNASEKTYRSSIPLQSLLDFDMSFVLGQENMSIEQLEDIYEHNKPFTKWNGEWVLLDHDSLKKAVAWAQKQKKKGKVTLKDALFLQAMSEDSDFMPVSILSFQSEGWVSQWLDLVEAKNTFEPLAQPETFQGTLRSYQCIGMSWLIQLRHWGMGACLSDDMGLGKTIQFLAYLAYCKEKGWVDRPFLLICPTSVLGNWEKEIERFVPDLKFYIHHGPNRLTVEEFTKQTGHVDIVMTTYSIIQRDFLMMQRVNWDGVVLDEAQHIKNAATIQAKVIRTIPCDHRIALTGTPIENRLEELWSIFEFLNGGYLGSLQTFRREFVQPIEKAQNSERLSSLRKLIRPFFLRRSKNDPAVVSDLPDKIEQKEYCYLTREQAVLYEQVVTELLQREEKLQGIERKGLILAAISRLKQICSHPALILPDRQYTGHVSGKLTRLQEMVEEMISEGDRILIFTQFRKMGEIIKKSLSTPNLKEIPFLHGGVVKEHRDRMVDQFQSSQGSPIFLLSLKAGGVGLNLTRANRVIHFDRWWNPAVENQATDRAYRIGQKEVVHVHKMVCMGTIEEKIDQMMERKQQLVSEIIHTGENWVTELSSNELRDLVALRNELVE
ncbi:MAG TPA: DEAD/DEAH box helicase [Bacillota bacterium]|nr:DEAD/DEAH box helicase [Bacillota bacterium]